MPGVKGRSGRRAKSVALHHLHGTFNVTRHRNRVADERAPIALNLIDPEPPSWLSESQRVIWRETLDMAPPGLLCAVDSGLVGAYVWQRDLLNRTMAEVARSDDARRRELLQKVATRTIRLIVKLKRELRLGRTADEAGE